jgi:YidC/Oxa1 family membrane protein insertase
VAILLYWLTNNLWTLVQQHIVFRKLDAEEARRPTPAAAVPPVSAVVLESAEAAPVPALRPGAKPVARSVQARQPTNSASRTGGKAASGRRAAVRRGH